jgi:hypothetical protein
MQAAKRKVIGTEPARSPSLDDSTKTDTIFEVVWGELRQYPHRDYARERVAERVAMYSKSGLPDDLRIKLAVLNSFGRCG